MSHPRQGFNTALNGYRGLCAALVFVYHLGSAGVMPLPRGDAFSDGLTFLWSSLAYGVEMFFMISGFVILGSLLRHASVAEFLKDRFIRIFSAWVPALVAVTLVCSALNMKMLADLSFLERLGIFTANLLLLPPLVPLPLIHFGSWSLTYEWVFYFTAATGALKLDTTYRLDGLTDQDGKRLAKIGLTAKATPGAGAKINIKSQDHSGTIVFSADEGRVVEISQTQKLVTERPYRETTILVTLNSTQKTTVKPMSAGERSGR